MSWNNRPWLAAALLSWLILSGIAAAAVAVSLRVPEELVAQWTPVCERRALTGDECSLCGMTRAFFRISRGEFREAAAANRGSIPLYGGFVLSQLGVALCAFSLYRRRQSSPGE